MRHPAVLFAFTLSVQACTSAAESIADRTAALTIENRSGAQLWYVSYADCGSADYTGLLGRTEYLANGDDLSSGNVPPGCYDVYVEDEYGCSSVNDTDGNVGAGFVFTWTVLPRDLRCR